jgi:hypothetical protein
MHNIQTIFKAFNKKQVFSDFIEQLNDEEESLTSTEEWILDGVRVTDISPLVYVHSFIESEPDFKSIESSIHTIVNEQPDSVTNGLDLAFLSTLLPKNGELEPEFSNTFIESTQITIDLKITYSTEKDEFQFVVNEAGNILFCTQEGQLVDVEVAIRTFLSIAEQAQKVFENPEEI